MKEELSIEKKAEAYDERLAKARKEYSIHEANNAIGIMDALERVFPELRESEDESIKEWLINLVKGHIEWLEDRIREQLSNGQVYGDELVKAKNSLAWLEKQGEKGTNGNERDISNLEPPLTIKHAREVLGIKQNDDWSEEDKTMVEDIIEAIDTQYAVTDYNEMVNWLKSLKDRYTWKPSELQIEALAIAIRCGIKLGTWEEEALKDLIEQLKRLKS